MQTARAGGLTSQVNDLVKAASPNNAPEQTESKNLKNLITQTAISLHKKATNFFMFLVSFFQKYGLMIAFACSLFFITGLLVLAVHCTLIFLLNASLVSIIAVSITEWIALSTIISTILFKLFPEFDED